MANMHFDSRGDIFGHPPQEKPGPGVGFGRPGLLGCVGKLPPSLLRNPSCLSCLSPFGAASSKLCIVKGLELRPAASQGAGEPRGRPQKRPAGHGAGSCCDL